MGIFDCYLICSDIDGTFTGGDRLQENLDAVRYFTENGGHFTFATGRAANHLRDCGLLPVVNCPACLCNGSVIYDYQSEQLLRETYLHFSISEFLEACKNQMHQMNRLHTISNGTGSIVVFDRENATAEDLATNPIKLVCRFDSPEKADAFQCFAVSHPLFRDTYISKSWSHGVEFNHASSTKGHALDFLKAHLGNIHTTVGIGDYENDLPLIAHADIGVAVANAVAPLKQAADMIVCANQEAAIKDLIKKLDVRLQPHRKY